MTDELDGAQPRCPVDSVVMRDIPGGWKCPACGHIYAPAIMQQQEQPPDFEGPTIHGG